MNSDPFPEESGFLIIGNSASTTDIGIPPYTCGHIQPFQESRTTFSPTGIAGSSLVTIPHLFNADRDILKPIQSPIDS